MKRLVVFALILGIALSVSGSGIGQEEEPDADLSKLVAEMAELLDQALYLSIAALSWPDRDDLELYIQGIINLLDGPGSPDYDASGSAATPNESGLKDLFFTFLTARSGVETVATPHIHLSIFAQAVQAAEHTERYLFLAAEAAKAARGRVYSVTGGRQELRQTYAYLLAARGKTSDELLLGGLGTLVEVFPSLDIWVGPDESIQAAIDRAPAGATIHLEPGAYRERIIIDKDLTLIGEPADETDHPMAGTIGEPVGGTDRPMAGLIGVIWDIVVGITGDGVEVHLRNLYVANGTVGILASGDSIVHLRAVWIGQVNSAVTATDGATVHCAVCEFAECETAILVRSGASAYVSNSTLRDCASIGIMLLPGGSLTMTDTTISDCGGHAIYLQDDSTLHLERCLIYDNEGFGVFAYTVECELHFVPGLTSKHGFTGTITGANNTIPGPDEEHANLKGDICPEAYSFLKGGGPVIIPPGDSG